MAPGKRALEPGMQPADASAKKAKVTEKSSEVEASKSRTAISTGDGSPVYSLLLLNDAKQRKMKKKSKLCGNCRHCQLFLSL